MMRWVIPAVLLTALLVSPLSAPPAAAADVNVSLIAQGFAWHVGSASSSNSQIAVNVGDTIHLTIQNLVDNTPHTFTAPHFPAATGQVGPGPNLNVNLSAGATFVWNYTFTASDVGTWQYYCVPHSTGTYPNRTNMVGTIAVTTPAPPRTPGFEVVLVIAAVGIVVAAVRVLPRRKK